MDNGNLEGSGEDNPGLFVLCLPERTGQELATSIKTVCFNHQADRRTS
ncbi:hypothetical protein L1285_08385 [Pseudoalteromonas sp. DL2-H2.2]|nr:MULTISPECIES: hypothetical protein [Pseudoalteromonas]MCF2908339.1 hypothetical protein [Pseudoalteromonas sp. DL2-H2.2]